MLFRSRFDHVLHAQASVEGRLRFQGAMLLEGQVTGPVDGEGDKTTLVVRGKVTGNIVAAVVHVEGEVVGNITAHTLAIGPKGRVIGDVGYLVLHAEEGSLLEGRVQRRAVPEPSNLSKTSSQGSASQGRARLLDTLQADQALVGRD